MAGLGRARLLWVLSLRNLVAHRAKSLIVGSIMFFGTVLLVIGGALLDSVERSMAKSITGSVGGHLQLYSKDAKDDLALFGSGFMGKEDVGRIDDFSKVRDALQKVPNVRAVVPMGMDMGTISSPGELERTLGALREAVRNGVDGRVPELRGQIREIVKQMIEEQSTIEAIAQDKKAIQERVSLLNEADSDPLWARFDEHPLDVLEFLDTKVAPLAEDGRMLYFRYLGTDLDLFQMHFDRFEIAKGQMVPSKKRGFLLNDRYYEQWVKNYVARNLDKIDRALTEDGKTIAKDALLQAIVRNLQRQYRRITYHLDSAETVRLRRELGKLLGSDETDVAQLLEKFLDVNDANFKQRYAFFYDEIVPMIDLYEINIGDVVTIRTFTRSGFLKAINVRLYGTFHFKGLEKSELAGAHNLIDLASFRELYGLMTAEKLEEMDAIRKEIGLEAVKKDDVEAALFGSDATIVEAAEQPDDFNEFANVDLTDERERLAALEEASLTQEEIDRGLALNAAVVFEDPQQMKATKAAVVLAVDQAQLGLKVVDWLTAAGLVGQFLWVIRFVLYTAIFIIFTVAIVIINNSMVMATMERVTEIGTMRAIGASRWLVLAMFLFETIALGLLAGAAGMAVGAGLVGGMGKVGIPATHNFLVFLFGGPRLHPFFGANNLVFGAAVILVVSVIATFYPAFIATRIQPVTAMSQRE